MAEILHAIVPVVISFEFKQFAQHLTDLLITFLNYQFKVEFLRNFVSYLVTEFEVENAVKTSQHDAIEHIIHRLSRDYTYLDVSMTNYKTSSKEIQFPDIEELFNNTVRLRKRNAFELKTEIKSGEIQEKTYFNLTKVIKFDKILIKRKIEIIRLHELLLEKKNVNLYGERDLGKTTFS